MKELHDWMPMGKVARMSEARIKKGKFANFEEFYTFYKSIHENPRVRFWHSVGQFLFFAYALAAILHHNWTLILWGLFTSYTVAWLSHKIFDGNSPATWRHPLWSLKAGGRMFRESRRR